MLDPDPDSMNADPQLHLELRNIAENESDEQFDRLIQVAHA